MPFELISEEEMATKSRKEKLHKKVEDTGNLVIKEKEEGKEGKEIKIEGKEIEGKEIKKEIKIEGKEIKDITNAEVKVPSQVIVKRIYFPGDKYSKNQAEFKKIIANYGLSWYKPMYKMYVSNRTGEKLGSGMYVSDDKSKKVFCIYEGSGKPMTAIMKIIGTGGNFLIEMNSFCTKIGCTIEDKDELYSDKVLSTLKEKGEIYVGEEKKETIENIEEKIKLYVETILQKYVDAYKDSLERRGVSLETFKFFKRKEIEEDVKRGIESGYIKLWISSLQ